MIIRADKVSERSISRIVPIDNKIKEEMIEEYSGYLDEWTRKWFNDEILITEVNKVQGSKAHALLKTESDEVFAVCCSQDELFRYATGLSINDIKIDSIASEFSKEILKDLLSLITRRKSKVTFNLDVALNDRDVLFIWNINLGEIDFNVSLLKSAYSNYISEKYSSSITKPLNEVSFLHAILDQTLAVDVTLPKLNIPLSKVINLSVGDILEFDQKLSQPLTMSVGKNKIGSAFLGKEGHVKTIKIGEKLNDY